MSEAFQIQPPPPVTRRAKRREAILAAAKRLFLDKGFDAVSMGEIVRASGGSLSTLYELFESKEGVLAAIVVEDKRETLDLMRRLIDRHAPPREMLSILVNDLHAEFFQPDMIGMLRLIMTESLRNDELNRLLQESAFTPFDTLLITLFRQWTADGTAKIDRPEIAADLLIGMMIHSRLKEACGNAPAMSAVDRAATADAAVAMFTTYYGIA